MKLLDLVLILFLPGLFPLPAMAQEACNSYGADRLVYQKHDRPVLVAGKESWEAGGLLHIAICQVDSVYYLYYTALQKPPGYAYRSIGLATSKDGIHWKRSSKRPVLSRGAAGEFDDVHVHMPTVLYDASQKKFKMWYVGYQNNKGNTIGYAESADGKLWKKKGQVLSFGERDRFDSGSLREPSVTYDASTRLYKMWYNGTMPGQHYGPTGYAISEDGIHWGRVTVINGDQKRFVGIDVVLENDCYHGWYGKQGEIGYAFSFDGIRWHWPIPEVVLSRSPGGFDSSYLQAPVVIVDRAANKVRLWYNAATTPGEILAIGYAEARINPR